MWSRTPKVGEQIIAHRIEGVFWPDDAVLRGVVTFSEPENFHFRFMPDEPDPSRNGPNDYNEDARTFDPEYGWHVDAQYDDAWEMAEYVITEEEDIWSILG